MRTLLKQNRQRIDRELSTIDQRMLFSPVVYATASLVLPLIERYARGKLLDIGCGDMPFKDVIEKHAAHYDTLDVTERAPGVKFIGDVQDMSMIPSQTYDSAVCLEVLEHVADPFKAAAEIQRVLKKDGVCIFSVPHLSRLHEEPHDYFRFTKYGLQSIFTRSGFEILELKDKGGIFSFLGHQWSTGLLCLVWRIPVLKQVIFTLNLYLCVKLCCFLDRHIFNSGVLTLGYVGVVRKK